MTYRCNFYGAALLCCLELLALGHREPCALLQLQQLSLGQDDDYLTVKITRLVVKYGADPGDYTQHAAAIGVPLLKADLANRVYHPSMMDARTPETIPSRTELVFPPCAGQTRPSDSAKMVTPVAYECSWAVVSQYLYLFLCFSSFSMTLCGGAPIYFYPILRFVYPGRFYWLTYLLT